MNEVANIRDKLLKDASKADIVASQVQREAKRRGFGPYVIHVSVTKALSVLSNTGDPVKAVNAGIAVLNSPVALDEDEQKIQSTNH